MSGIKNVPPEQEVIDDDLERFQAHFGVGPEFYEPVEWEIAKILGKVGLVLGDLGRAYCYFLGRPGDTVGGFMWAVQEDLERQGEQ